MHKFSNADRDFFSVLDRVVYGNPFSDRRDRLIQRLAPDSAKGDLDADRDTLARAVEPRLRPYEDSSALDRLGADDRRLVRSGFLYVCYQRHVPPIDRLIGQESSQRESVDRIAKSVIADLVGHGIDEALAVRYFALFFQLRRAFHFIGRSLTGNCESMRKLRSALWDNIFTHDMREFETGLWKRMEDFSTLILGETGTGKGAAAAAIGRSEFIPYLPAERRFAANFADSFIAINLSQFAESLIESELFGHRKGAFTGAIEHHQGVFERCNAHGALFLDEIGEASVPIQIKLLQVLQERTFTPLGSHEKKRFAGRVIAATNRPLGGLRASGRFRDDFYYRLCSDVIEVPTLRQRIEESARELEELVRLLVTRIGGEENAERAAFVLEALERDLPRGYPWPGNVRELEQAVRRILLTGRYAAGLSAESGSEDDRLADMARAGTLSAQELLGRYCALLYRRFGTYAEVAERTGLDRRTARKYVVDYSAATRAAP
ncbi:MAG TPA: sigma 54-interacting transcriptional regulator [Burkholderiales bacterium]|jgi:MoxR-like ATPase|nr:sigma 54-interacting transcriptional regulator [Burkholderiales bacterium]